MSAKVESSLHDKMQALRQGYIDGLPARLADINAVVEILLNDWDEANASELRCLVHSLTGSGATFGFPELSHSASILEARMGDLLKQGAIDNKLVNEIQPLLADITKQITDIQNQPDDHVRKATWKAQNVQELDQKTKNKLILIVDDDDAVAQQLANTIEISGYTTHIIRELEDLQKSIKKLKPASIIMDLVFPESGLGGSEAIQKMQSIEGSNIPVIFISLRYDFDARLAVSRTGAKFFFNKPINASKLIRALDEITVHKPRDQYRVMIVDDDQDIAEYHSMILKNAGMATQIVSSPSEILEQVPIFAPELIVMDLYMPDCNGTDLAHIIRQDNAYDLMPIVFLSSETNVSLQMGAIKSGGDDFLTKPVSPGNLISLISTRIERARILSTTTQELRSALRENQTQKMALDQHAIVSIADPEGLITYTNDKFCEISKYNRNELIGKNHRLLNSGTHSKDFFKDMWEHISNGKIWHGEIKNIGKDGTHYWVDSTIMPFLNDQGVPYQYISIRTDITHIKNAEEEMRETEARLKRQQAALMSLANDELLLSGNLEEVISEITETVAYTMEVETVAVRFYDTEKSALQCIDKYSKASDTHENGILLESKDYPTYFSALNNVRVIVADDVLTQPEIIELSDSYLEKNNIRSIIDAPIRRQGKLMGALSIGSTDQRHWWMEDQNFIVSIADLIALTMEQIEHKEAAERLRISEERLNRSQSFANIGTWDWDIKTGKLFWSERIGPLFGYGDEQIDTTYENFIAAVHPDDRPLVTDAVNACVEDGVNYDIEHRIITQEGETRWVQERGNVIRDKDNKPLHMLGVVQDITLRKQAEEGRTRRQELLDLLRTVTSQFVDENIEEYQDVFDNMLSGILKLTNSEYGFIGEILHDDETPYLKTHAITNIAWDNESREFYEKNAPQGLEFKNLDSLFGAAIKNKSIIISNIPADDKRAGGLPDGHPDLNAFLGVPVFYGNEMVGMYGLANHPGGYSQEIIDFLEPFNSTLGVIINGIHTNKESLAAQRALVVAKEEAESANKAKSQFLSSMSHELRTPLNAILGFAQLFEYEDEDPLNDSQLDNVQQILKSGWHLLELINEILDLSKIESGSISLSMEGVELNEVLEECTNLIEPLAQKRHIKLINSVPEDKRSILIFADRTRIKQVLINLMSNAVKYNKDKGSITIECSQQNNNRLRICVTDTGAGIPEAQQTLLFQPFERLGADKSEIEGTGIGLVITKRLTELMGGTIGFKSTPKKGSTFWIDIDTISSSDISDINRNTGEISLKNPAQLSEKKITILYVEDNPANLKLVWQILSRKTQFEMLSAHTAELGLELAQAHLPDIILMDINLPGMDGYEAMARLRANESTKDIPVLALSANAMPSDIEKGVAAGFCEYLTKPINVKNFNEVLQKVVSSIHDT